MGDFNTSLTPMDRSSKQKINKKTLALNNTLDKIDLTDIKREIYNNKIIVGNFNISLTSMYGSSIQKISKE